MAKQRELVILAETVCSPTEAGKRRIKLNNHHYAKERKDMGKCTEFL